ncbi:MAG: 16S rRNA (cytosine(1402)-N(4))-methyltransferase RsmH [Propionibacteriaceae bacterium]|jgi:16S rRNA (cytosine1402-N4)-methyltransferase|nr:16S rRNA (cytosine(1402)-N(4))-methyltransferase RsmH [Propionibacteriaceae bacterium]
MTMTETPPRHRPVMAERVLELLTPALSRPGAVLADLTLGLGGHAAALLEACPQARLVGLDRDGQALELARRRLAAFAGRTRLVQTVFDRLPQVLEQLGLERLDAVLLDLGLSSLQIDSPERGFAYARPQADDAPLDMRMDAADDGLTAADIVNTWPAPELARLFRQKADEAHARRIAEAIVAARERAPLTTTGSLAAVVAAAVPPTARRRGHPAKRTFQALRMAVNRESEALAAVLPAALAALGPGGRIVVLSYHSGEDRMVKQALAAAARDQAPPGLAVVPDHLAARFRPLTSGAEKPCPAELAANPRSTSARLRAAERLRS